MRLVYVITRGDDVGGAQVHVVELATWMQTKFGRDVTVLCGPGDELRARLDSRNIRHACIPTLQRAISPSHDIRAIRDLRSVLAELDPDLVSLHSSKAGIVGRVASKLAGVPCVFTAHGWSFGPDVDLRTERLNRSIERQLATMPAHTITVSDADRKLALDIGIPPERVTTVPNGMPALGVPVPRSFEAPRPMRFISVARFDSQKDHATLLRAFAALEHEVLPELWLVGDGPQRSEVAALIHHLGLSDRVEMLGLRDDVDELLRSSDAFVLVSNWEGMPRSIIEAQRAGLATVATNVGGVAEIITDNRTGLLANRGSIEDVRNALDLLLRDRQVRERLSRAAYENFSRNFTFERTAAATDEVYSEVLGRIRGAS